MHSTLASTLAARVRQERLRLGWTQSDAAARVGISLRSYQRFEHATTLSGIDRVLAAFDLTLTVTSGDGTSPVPDPCVMKTRQRGVRHLQPRAAKPPPSAAPQPPASAPVRATSTPPPPAQPPAPSVDPAQLAAVAKAQRDRIVMTVRTIVSNRLTNVTAYQVVQNVMNAARDLAAADRPAFVAALVAQLNGLTPENLPAYGLTATDLQRWSATWNPDRGIVDVLSPLTG